MYNNILLPIDINDKDSWQLSFAKITTIMSLAPNSKLNIMTVVPTYGLGMIEEYFPKNWVRDITQKSQKKLEDIVTKNLILSNQIELFVDRGVVYQEILNRAEKIKADLVVMSAHHPNRSDYLLGPNVAKVARHSPHSVLIVRDNHD